MCIESITTSFLLSALIVIQSNGLSVWGFLIRMKSTQVCSHADGYSKRHRVITKALSKFIRIRKSRIGKIVGIFTHRRGNLHRLFAVVSVERPVKVTVSSNLIPRSPRERAWRMYLMLMDWVQEKTGQSINHHHTLLPFTFYLTVKSLTAATNTTWCNNPTATPQ